MSKAQFAPLSLNKGFAIENMRWKIIPVFFVFIEVCSLWGNCALNKIDLTPFFGWRIAETSFATSEQIITIPISMVRSLFKLRKQWWNYKKNNCDLFYPYNAYTLLSKFVSFIQNQIGDACITISSWETQGG